MLPSLQKSTALFEGSQTSPACPSDKSSIELKMSMEHWWSETDGGNRSTQRETCSSATLSTTNLTRYALRLNLCICNIIRKFYLP
jgi:hypothetical protein